MYHWELIAANWKVVIHVMVEFCQGVLYIFGMLVEWALSIDVPIFMGNLDIKNCSCY